uniref:Uncharacterized protein n=1 Tax=Anguilla anguilla TaxID=7936 RepID=A0A0E9VBJ5_ANGAN
MCMLQGLTDMLSFCQTSIC